MVILISPLCHLQPKEEGRIRQLNNEEQILKPFLYYKGNKGGVGLALYQSILENHKIKSAYCDKHR